MDGVNRTLYIPLYGKSYVSKRGLFLEDKTAEEIWAAEGFRLRGKSASKWLAFYMGIRAVVFDDWVRRRMAEDPEAMVLHLGCGLDSRCRRAGDGKHLWYDVDFGSVIRERRRYFSETDSYRMISGDVREEEWLNAIPESRAAIVVMEGISMYLTPDELLQLTGRLSARFQKLVCLMDCYTVKAAKLSRYRNPINDVGVTRVFGMDDPAVLEAGNFRFAGEHEMTPRRYVDQLHGMEKRIFATLYAGRFSQSLYRMYEYHKA